MACKCRYNPLNCKCCNCCYIPQRWIGTLLMAMVIIIPYGQRVCLSMTIVRMVMAPVIVANKSVSGCPIRPETSTDIAYGDNDWTQSQQSNVISMFYVGYLVMHIPAGILCDYCGPRWPLMFSCMISTIISAVIPIVVDTPSLNWWCLLTLRIVQGFSQGTIFPAISAWIARWVPTNERAKLGAIAFSGIAEGCILGTLLSGYLMSSYGDWRVVFYFWGICGGVLTIFLFFYVFSGPDVHPFITDAEQDYLHHWLVPQSKKKIPYLRILTDPVVWAMFSAQLAHSLLVFFFVNYLPKYMDNVLNFRVMENTLASSLPYIGQWLCSILTGMLADWGISKKGWERGLTRKVYTLIGGWVPPVMCVLASYSGCDDVLAILFFSLSLFFTGPYFSGTKIIIIDFSTQYAGITTAFSNGLGALMGYLAPTICSSLAPNNTLEEWHNVFWTILGVSLILDFIYMLFGSSKRRRWDYTDEEQKYFTTKQPCCKVLCMDGVDQDALDVQAGYEAAVARGEIKPQPKEKKRSTSSMLFGITGGRASKENVPK